MNEKRRFNRLEINLRNVYSKTLFINDVKIINISVGGALIKTDRRMNINKDYILKLKNKKRFLVAEGKVIWFTLLESYKDYLGNIVPVYFVGLKFNNTSSEKLKDISDFIKDYFNEYERFDEMDLYKMSGQRLNMRFPLGMLDGNTTYFYHRSRVKNISLGGMLIESEEVHEIEDRHLMDIILPGNKILSFVGRIVRCSRPNIIGKKLYETGIEFVDMLDQDKKILKEFIYFN